MSHTDTLGSLSLVVHVQLRIGDPVGCRRTNVLREQVSRTCEQSDGEASVASPTSVSNIWRVAGARLALNPTSRGRDAGSCEGPPFSGRAVRRSAHDSAVGRDQLAGGKDSTVT